MTDTSSGGPEVEVSSRSPFLPFARLLDSRASDPVTVSTVLDAYRLLPTKAKIGALFHATGPDGNPVRAQVLLVAALNDDAEPSVAQAAAAIFLSNRHLLNADSAKLVPARFFSSDAWQTEMRWVLGEPLLFVAETIAAGTYSFTTTDFTTLSSRKEAVATGRAMRTEALLSLVAFGRLGPTALLTLWNALETPQKIMLLDMTGAAPSPYPGDADEFDEEKDLLHAGLTWPLNHVGPHDFILAAFDDPDLKVVSAGFDVFLASPRLLPDHDRPAILRHLDSKDKSVRSKAMQALCWEGTAGRWAVFNLQMYASMDGDKPEVKTLRERALRALERLGFAAEEYESRPRRKTSSGIVLGVFNDSAASDTPASQAPGSDAA